MQDIFELTLCFNCARVFYLDDTRKIERKDMSQRIKEPCDICKRPGYDYVIEVEDEI